MTATLRAVWRLLRVVVHGLHGLAIVLLRFPSLGVAERQARVQWWSIKLLRVMGIGLETLGTPRPGGTLVVANHVSWLDIAAIHAVRPQVHFVSKADVKAWPLINRLVDAAGTLYVERERRRDAMRVMHTIAEALAAGEAVGVFPEGTTGDGHVLLPFHANLLQAAIAAEAPVQPVALRYRDARQAVSPAAAFVGDTSLAQSMWWIARAEGLVVRVQWLPAEASRHADRRALAALLHDQIALALGEEAERSEN